MVGRHLEMIKWARKHSAPCDENTCAGATRGGQLEVLQCARANGCPWDTRMPKEAYELGHFELLTWANANSSAVSTPGYTTVASIL